MASFLGLDLGTSAIKALLVRDTGEVIGRGSAGYPIHRPGPGAAEQDPAAWWSATIAATRQALTGSDETVAAIGLSGQMHGTVLLGDGDRPLAPAIIWPDQRSRRQVAEITARIGPERLIELTGSPVATGFQAATLLWLQQERPDLWAATRCVLLPKDELRRRLTGTVATEPSDASGTLLLDVNTRDWSPDVLDKLDIPRALLPAVQPSDAIAGMLQPEAAADLGMPPGIPVVVGAGDAPAGVLGAGVVGQEALLLSIGTGAQLLLPVETVKIDRRGRLHTFCNALAPAPDQPGWYQMGALLAAGLALAWLRDKVFALEGADAYATMAAWAAEAPLGAGGLLFLPYLVGERTPHMNPLARGIFLGLTAEHGRPELVRAVLEGITFACYDAFRVFAELGAAPERIVLAGGGTRSALWRQIVADVFGLPVHPLATVEQSALGAAILAGAGIGQFSPVAAARAWARYEPPLVPDPARHARYMELFAVFQDAYRKHKRDFAVLTAFAEGR